MKSHSSSARLFLFGAVLGSLAILGGCVADEPDTDATNSGADGGGADSGNSSDGNASGDATSDAKAPAPFSLSASPTTVTLSAGKQATSAITVTRVAPFAGALAITIAGLPADVTADPLTIAATDTSALLTLHASTTAKGASSSATVAGTDGTSSASTPLVVTVSPGPGIIDSAFGTSGTTDTTSNSLTTLPAAVLVQPDDKILVGANDSAAHFVLFRYNANGTLDPTFNGTGISVTTVSGALSALALQSDGKIVAVGSHTVGSDLGWAVVRYNADGTLDTAFGTSGIASRSDSGYAVQFPSVAIQADGKILVAGTERPSANDSSGFASVLRFTTAGVLDTTFGSNGIALVPGDTNASNNGTGPDIRTVKIQSTGEIVVGGVFAFDATPAKFYFMGYSSAGVRNTGFFGFAGQPTAAFQESAMALDADDNLVLVGAQNVSAHFVMAIERSSAALGQLDTGAFGTTGVTTVNATGNDAFDALAVQSDGKIVGCGTSTAGGPLFGTELVRFTSVGAVDTAFGTSGTATVSAFTGSTRCVGVALQKSGEVIVLGDQNVSNVHHVRLARYWP